MVEPLTSKYSPKKINDLIGNDEVKEIIRRWALNWLSGNKRKPLLLYGPPGVGKTSTAYALASEYGFEIIEMNASDLRNKERVEQVALNAANMSTLSGSLRLILIDDVDIFIGKKDTGGLGAVVRTLKETSNPIILTATDIWDKKLAPIRVECERIEFKRVSRVAIKKHLATIAKNEGIEINESELDAIVQNSNGDVRSAIIDLQAKRPSPRDREEDIFWRVRSIFKANTYAEAKEALKGDLDYKLLLLWLDENIPEEYERKEDLAKAFFWLSRSDVFLGRAERGDWVMLKYSLDLMSAGVGLAKETVYRKFTKYQYPSYLKKMGASVETRRMLMAIGEKVGRITHTNAVEARSYFKFLAKIPESLLSEKYLLEDEEIAFLRVFESDKL
ncbi:MAG: replication factor C large subunit [Candidatus Bilamarchaeaceae archaeon]